MEFFANDIFVCNECGHIFSNIQTNTSIYNDVYYRKFIQYSLTSNIDTIRADLVEKYVGAGAEISVLDIGYGSGSFLKEMSSRGHECFGYEVSRCNFNVHRIHEMEGKEFDCISIFDCLEHMDDPYSIFEAKTEVYIVSLPIFRDDISEIFGWKHYKPTEHKHYFTDSSIDKFFMRKDFYKVYLSNVEDEIRGSFFHGKPNISTYIFRNN